MTLTKTQAVDKIEIVGQYKHIQVRVANYIKENNAIIASSFSRYVISPGDDVSNESEEVQNIVNLVHTPELVEEYRKSQIAEISSVA